MKFIFVFFFAFLSLFQFANSQVKVTSITNHVFYGIIIENTNDTLKLIDENRLKIIIPKSNIAFMEETQCYISTKGSDSYYGRIISYSEKGIKMECEDGSIREFNYNNARISFSGSEYPFLGLTLGTPGGINLVAGAYFGENIGFSLQGGILPNSILGGQLNCLINISRKKAYDQNFGLCAGALLIDNSYTRDDDWEYLGAFYEINYHGVYFQGGLSVGSGTFVSPQIIFQLGYVYRFND